VLFPEPSATTQRLVGTTKETTVPGTEASSIGWGFTGYFIKKMFNKKNIKNILNTYLTFFDKNLKKHLKIYSLS
jgi:hypothetical protein